jgi:hypothetical protein
MPVYVAAEAAIHKPLEETSQFQHLAVAGLDQKKWLAGSPSRPTKRSSHFEMKRLLLYFDGLQVPPRRRAISPEPP